MWNLLHFKNKNKSSFHGRLEGENTFFAMSPLGEGGQGVIDKLWIRIR